MDIVILNHPFLSKGVGGTCCRGKCYTTASHWFWILPKKPRKEHVDIWLEAHSEVLTRMDTEWLRIEWMNFNDVNTGDV